MNKSTLLSSILVVILCAKMEAQYSGTTGGGQSVFPEYLPNLLPASPDACSFTKYGSLPIGLSTGTTQFSLPVYTIKSGSLVHPISINYSSNGVKVDEMATRVGINWNLKAGGMITRIVLDKPDEAPGVDTTFLHVPIFWDSSSAASWTFYDYVRQSSYATAPDYQPDEYSYTIDGYSGKFLRRQNGEFTQYNANGVRIEENSSGFILTSPDGTKYFFYLFEVAKNYSYPETTTLEWIPALVPTAWYLTKILSPTRDSIVFNYSPLLGNPDSVITYKNGISQNFNAVTFDGYAVYTGEYYTGFTGFPVELPYIRFAIHNPPPITTIVQQTDNKPNYLSSIDFANGTVEFIYSSRMDVLHEKKLDSIKIKRTGDNKLIKCTALQYTYSQSGSNAYDTYLVPGTNYTNTDSSLRKRLFLTSFHDVGNDLASKQIHSFEYEDINGLPPRLSFSQDRYGSFNSKVNTYFFPNDTWFDKLIGNTHFGGDRTYLFNSAKKGILKKINFPTGGYTLFDFGPNKTENDYAWTYSKDSVYAVVDTSSYNGQEFYSDTIHWDGQGDLILKGFCEWASDPVYVCEGELCEDFDEAYYLTHTIINANTGLGCSVYMCGGNTLPVNQFYFGLFGLPLDTGRYYIKITASRPRLRGRATLEHTIRISDRSDSSGVSGIRVKNIADYTSTGHETNRRQFHYGSWDDSLSTSGVGLNLDANNGNELSMTRLVAPSAQFPNMPEANSGYNTIHSNSNLTTFLSENSTVFYKKVIEINTGDSTRNNGATEYEFYYDQKKNPIPVTFQWGQYLWDPVPLVPPGAPYMNNDFRTGSIKSTKVFSYQQKFASRNILQESRNYYSLDTAHLVIDTFTVSKEVIKRTERSITWPYFFDYDIYRYWRYFGHLRQDSVVSIAYAPTGQISNKVVYFNYNTQNFLPNDLRVFSSMGETKMIARKYVCDVGIWDPDYSLYLSMKNANIIDALLEEKNYISTTMSSSTELTKKKMSFGSTLGLYLPDSVWFSQRAGTEYLEMQYQLYDSSGNLQQYTSKDGVINSVIWGYNKTVPVAKVVGKTYNDAISESSINMSIVNNPSSENAIKTELNKLRTLSNCFTSTFVWSPLVGITSQTDPNGNITHYEYDNFNRLHLVRDKDSNVLKKICYNYQGQPIDCGFGNAAAWQAISSRCDTVGGGFTGNLIVTEKDMNPASGTYNTTRTYTIVDSHACPPPPPCSGNDKKLINNICETGVKVCTSMYRIGQTWYHDYHYEWSDNSSSITYTSIGTCLEL